MRESNATISPGAILEAPAEPHHSRTDKVWTTMSCVEKMNRFFFAFSTREFAFSTGHRVRARDPKILMSGRLKVSEKENEN